MVGAADYFQRVLARYPDDQEAIAGLDAIADQLLTNAETALLEVERRMPGAMSKPRARFDRTTCDWRS
jgi:hypothetical protein